MIIIKGFHSVVEVQLLIVFVGHAAMEAACCNLIEPGDVVLVCINGLWGERFAEMVERHGTLFD